ncbi:Autophagy-related protein [Pseudocercospora fuligena]|uniref:Autophagy-related protein n=1 Tax=Pseudocercospora fuligena TaxID=685502 RepID=A0A8H6RD09_9PEZI|nr:Autophagy-related protein [Pseudocercospora fuligena]
MTDRVFGHALNTVNKIRPGSQKPPSADRLSLYGLYKQSMEGDVALIADRPNSPQPNQSSDSMKKEQEKWDAWKANEGLGRTEAKRRYIEKLIETMHKYASTTPEARELVEELEFVWDQIKSNSQHSSSEHSSPLQTIERRDYMNSGSSGGNGAVSSGAAAMEGSGRNGGLKVLAPLSQADEDEQAEEDREEFVDAPVSQIDEADLQEPSEPGGDILPGNRFVAPQRAPPPSPADTRWRKRIESSLIKMTTEVAALREQLESRRLLNYRRRHSWWGWILKLGWWATQLVVADAVILWVVILYLRRKDDRRLETAIRVLLGDAVAQVQNLSTSAKMPTMPRITARARSPKPKS